MWTIWGRIGKPSESMQKRDRERHHMLRVRTWAPGRRVAPLTEVVKTERERFGQGG